MTLKEFITDSARRRELASALGTAENYLYQLANRWRGRRPSPEMAQRIEAATRQIGPEAVSKESLIFGDCAGVVSAPAPAKGGAR